MASEFEIDSQGLSGQVYRRGVKCEAFAVSETAHSWLPESAGPRSTERQCHDVDAAPTGSAQPRFACGALSRFDCRHGLRCTTEWWRRECAGEAGRSRRPQQWRVSGAGSTRIRQTRIVRPAIGAAAPVRGEGQQYRGQTMLHDTHPTGLWHTSNSGFPGFLQSSFLTPSHPQRTDFSRHGSH